ncbi:hypothetical protein LN139_08470 [Pseudomonas sp. KNUC1026]|nr:hypothetical protein [Pseudomonas sp. KNUC1026]UFH51064.1 hypothetical protein LN139_08470 [Pseudomonas sp. KNUC1026]
MAPTANQFQIQLDAELARHALYPWRSVCLEHPRFGGQHRVTHIAADGLAGSRVRVEHLRKVRQAEVGYMSHCALAAGEDTLQGIQHRQQRLFGFIDLIDAQAIGELPGQGFIQ